MRLEVWQELQWSDAEIDPEAHPGIHLVLLQNDRENVNYLCLGHKPFKVSPYNPQVHFPNVETWIKTVWQPFAKAYGVSGSAGLHVQFN